MEAIATQLSQLQEQVQTLSLLPSVVARLTKENDDQASSISLLQSKNDAQEASISHLYAENDSLRSLLHFHETEAHPRGRFVYDPAGLVVGGVKKGRWRWYSPSYSLSEVARGGVNDDVRFATMEDLPVEIMDEITSLLTLSEKAKLCGVSYRVLEMVSSSVYGTVVLEDAQKNRSVSPSAEARYLSSRVTTLPTPTHLFLPSPNISTSPFSRFIDFRQSDVLVTHLHLISDSQFENDLRYWYSTLTSLQPEFLHLRSSPTFTTAFSTTPSTYASFSSSSSGFGIRDLGLQVSHWTRLRAIIMSGPGSVLVQDGAFAFEGILVGRGNGRTLKKWEMIARLTRLDSSVTEVENLAEALDRTRAGANSLESVVFELRLKQ